MEFKNKYYILRHGEAHSNVKGFVSSWPEKVDNPLTERGVEQAEEAGEKLLGEDIDLVFSSDVLRCKQTAEIVTGQIKVEPKYDERLREIDFGIFNGKPVADFVGHFKSRDERINGKAPKGESYGDILKRVKNFLDEMEETYEGKKILVISHQAPLFILEGVLLGYSLEESVNYFTDEKLLSNCEIRSEFVSEEVKI